MFAEKYTAWAAAPGSSDALVAWNTSQILEQRKFDRAHIHADGWWGEYEWVAFPQPHDVSAPYLAYIPLPSTAHNAEFDVDTLWRKPVRADRQTVSSQPRLYTLANSYMGPLNARVDWVKTVKHNECLAAALPTSKWAGIITLPLDAILRARIARAEVQLGQTSWAQLLMWVRAAQRALLEVTSFVIWWRDVGCPGRCRKLTTAERRAMRGSIASNSSTYREIGHLGIPVFLPVNRNSVQLDGNRRFAAATRSSRCDTRDFLMPIKSVVEHDCPLWLYPPTTQSHGAFESAARGHAPRLDEWNPSAQYQAMNRAGRYPRYVQEPLHPEVRRWQKERPAYAPPRADIWEHAMLHAIDLHVIKEYTEPRKFDLPPVHLFWGRGEQHLSRFYLRAQQLSSSNDRRISAGQAGFTTQEWRGFLNDTYWKVNTPTMDDHFDPASDYAFNEELFYQFGSASFFTANDDQQIKSGTLTPITAMACGCLADATTFDNLDNRATFIYQLSLETFLHDLRDLDAHFKLGEQCTSLLTEFVYKNGRNHPPAWATKSVVERAHWVFILRSIVLNYPHRDFTWPDKGFVAKMKNMVELDSMVRLDENGLRSVEVYLLAFLIDTFKTTLGYYPVPLCYPPKYYTLACSSHRENHV
ncbi:hypothetical protein FA95DRAFT_1576716 [Auriscalpium vulgare]|uniref:Uncharacterized protein n=1 Tax=Auriscalpium vulgare TaxID=40419 RepID=A0ACB8R9S1_9AGAM|nr:hypothetical protein FA95DRAFT_1576716 [Auriscalpium vulgare]